MKNKGLIVVAVVIVALIAVFLVVKKPNISKAVVAKGKIAEKAFARTAAAPAKRIIPKDRGALVVKFLDYKGKEINTRLKAFKVVDSDSSIYAASFTANRPQDLLPGSYDIELDTVPQKIYRNVAVSAGKENSKDLGSITGNVNIKALASNKKNASYRVKIMENKSNNVLVMAVTNRPVDIISGIYDIEVESFPKYVKKDVKIEAGKENVLDWGLASGALTVKAVDVDKKEVKSNLRITKNNEVIFLGQANRPVEVLEGLYNIEILSKSAQSKKDVKVTAGEETVVEFTVEKPQAPPVKTVKK